MTRRPPAVALTLPALVRSVGAVVMAGAVSAGASPIAGAVGAGTSPAVGVDASDSPTVGVDGAVGSPTTGAVGAGSSPAVGTVAAAFPEVRAVAAASPAVAAVVAGSPAVGAVGLVATGSPATGAIVAGALPAVRAVQAVGAASPMAGTVAAAAPPAAGLVGVAGATSPTVGAVGAVPVGSPMAGAVGAGASPAVGTVAAASPAVGKIGSPTAGAVGAGASPAVGMDASGSPAAGVVGEVGPPMVGAVAASGSPMVGPVGAGASPTAGAGSPVVAGSPAAGTVVEGASPAVRAVGATGSPAAGAAAAAGSQAGDAQFHLLERAEVAGVQFRHDRGARGGRHPVETMGSGVAVLDYDGDGAPDLFFVQGGEVPGSALVPGGGVPGPGALFRNDGSGRFTEVTAAAGFGAPPPGIAAGFGMGVVAADLDDDGDPDLLLTRAGPDLLYENRGDGTFAPHPASPLPAPAVRGLPGGWSASAAFSDLDADGDLDLFVTRYLDWSAANDPECARTVRGERIRSYCLPDAFSGVPDLLYENRRGDFVPVSEAAGVALPTGKGLGVVAADLVGDPLPDLYVANDTVPNFLFENLGDLRFREVGLPAGLAYDGDGNALAGMGIAVADLEPDGDPDLFVTNFAGEANTLYLTSRRGFFDDASFPSGVGRPSIPLLGFGAVFADLDRDGLPDLCVTNGHVLDNAERLFADAAYRQPDGCFANRGGGRFERAWAAPEPSVGRGLAAGDFDGDGRVDLIGSRSGEPAVLYANRTPGGRSAALFLVGRESNRDAVGAVVCVRWGSSEQVFVVTAGDSYLSTSERAVRLGLGPQSTPSLGAVSVRWPTGWEQVLGVPTPGAFVVLEGVGILPLPAVNR